MAITIKIFERFSNLGLHSAAIVSDIVEKALKREPYVPVQDFVKDGIKADEIKIALQSLFTAGILVPVDKDGAPVNMPVIDMKNLDGIQIDNIFVVVKLQNQIQSAMDLEDSAPTREQEGYDEKEIGNATYRVVIENQYDPFAEDDNKINTFAVSISRMNFEIDEASSEKILTRVREVHASVSFETEEAAWKYWDDFISLRTSGVIRDRLNMEDGWVYGLRFSYTEVDELVEFAELVKFHETEAPDWHVVNTQPIDTEAQGFAWFEEQLDILWPATVEAPLAEGSTEARFASLEHIEDEEAKTTTKFEFDLKIGEVAVSITVQENAELQASLHALWYDSEGKPVNKSWFHGGELKTESKAKTAAEKWLKEFIY